ncbi:hypothetical protein QTP70_008522, partial [Hemibagrus guttatus]
TMSSTAAQNYCRQNYGDLATITTEEEFKEIVQVTGQTLVWIGLNRTAPNVDIWQWPEGNNKNFTKWSSTEPDGAAPDAPNPSPPQKVRSSDGPWGGARNIERPVGGARSRARHLGGEREAKARRVGGSEDQGEASGGNEDQGEASGGSEKQERDKWGEQRTRRQGQRVQRDVHSRAEAPSDVHSRAAEPSDVHSRAAGPSDVHRRAAAPSDVHRRTTTLGRRCPSRWGLELPKGREGGSKVLPEPSSAGDRRGSAPHGSYIVGRNPPQEHGRSEIRSKQTTKKIQVPKKTKITRLNDYRPVALTSVVMKSFERLMLSYLKDITDPLLDPLQFAYRANRSVDDAVNMALHFILQHLDSPGSYARILFVDFSSAFNTIIPALLRDKLFQLNVPDSMCSWITDFLTDRQQFVRLGTHASDLQHISTGSPQGCVLSPLLFSLYTDGCTSGHQSVKKFADDTTLIGLISDGDESAP